MNSEEFDAVQCLYCGESRGAIRASQRSQSPIFCGAVDYFGEVEWERDRHRFRSWSDQELYSVFHVKFEFADLYRRVLSPWEISKDHQLDWMGQKS